MALKVNVHDTVLLRAKLVSFFRRHPLPPGKMKPGLDEIEVRDRREFVEKHNAEIPIFKGRAWDKFWIYVVGLPQCRRIMRDHEAYMRPVTIDTTSIFEKGLMRQMEGEVHRQYRTQLFQAMKAVEFTTGFQKFSQETARKTDELAERAGTGPVPPNDLYEFLSDLAFNAFFRMIFGIQPEGPHADGLRRAYQQLGGNGLVWAPGQRQEQAVARVAEILREAAGDIDQNSVFGQLNVQGAVDKTMLGNLIYMVEMGRYDTTAFLRWLMWFAAQYPEQADRIASEQTPCGAAEAFVKEVLRLEQAERLVRRVKQDFVADGFLFPKGAMVRFCIWESHKLTQAHERPYDFSPDRFLDSKPGPERYAPFGVDRHQCPFATFSIQFGAAFLQAIVSKYRIDAEGSNGSVRGLYHWEPDKTFCPILIPRQTVGEK